MEKMISIAGGGLAGLSLGIGLRHRGIPVTIHEAGFYPRHRVCGEFISGVTPETLNMLGIADLFTPSRNQYTSVWFARGRPVSRQVLPTAAIGISRHCLDEALRERFENLGGVLQNSRLSCEANEGLVWCAGRRPVKGEWIGLKCHFTGFSTESDLEMHLGSAAYVGVAQVENGLTNICGLFRLRRDIRGDNTLETYLHASGLGYLVKRMESARMVPNSLSAVAGFQIGWQKNPTGLFALGDSLAMIPPFTGNGMSMAFESAEIAMDPLQAYATGDMSWLEAAGLTGKRLERRFRNRLFFAQRLHPFLTSTGGQAFFAIMARGGLLPFRFFFHLLR
jgi:menaquinone-9 beta-reductase